MRRSIFTILAVASLVVLLGLELGMRYDSWVRQVALSITNLVGLVSILLLARHFRKQQTLLPPSVSVALALGVWFDAAGNFAHLYARLEWWDKLAHAVGSAAVALAIWAILALKTRQKKIQVSRTWRSLMTIAFTAALASFYEISEYLGDLWFKTHRVTDLYDTDDDMLWNTLAVVVIVLLVVWVEKRIDERRRNQ